MRLLDVMTKVVLRADADIASLREQLLLSQATSRELSDRLTQAEPRERELAAQLQRLNPAVEGVLARRKQVCTSSKPFIDRL